MVISSPFTLLSAVTATGASAPIQPSCVILSPSTKFIRVNVSAYVTGTITVKAIF